MTQASLAARPRAPLAAATFLAFVALHPAIAEGPAPRIEFVSPRSAATVVGPAMVELRLDAPPGARIVRITVLVDGARLATLTSPPWTAPWDAGDALEPHLLEAIADFTDGRQARATVRTSPLRIDQYEQVSLVNLYAIVRDGKGAYVGGLRQEDFRVVEEGRLQTVSRFSDEWKPLRIAIVLDTSLSMQGDKLEAATEAALNFLETLRDEDRGLVACFSDAVDVVQPLTADRAALATAVRKARARGGTALYDAIWGAADLLEPHDGRRVIVLLSDGRDEAANGLEPGSLHTREEALDRALRAETMIFAIGFGRNLATERDFHRRNSLEAILREMAEATGGRALFSSRAGRLRRAFEEVADDLRHQYSLAYTSDDPKRDGGWREIRVSTTRPELRVVSRTGYFAPKDRSSAPGRKAKR